MAQMCIAVRLRIFARRVTNIYNRELRPHDLTIGQMNILVVAFRRGDASPRDVCQALHLEKSTLSRDVTRMCARGWVTRDRGQDGRATILRVTAAGKRLLKNAFPAWRAAQRKAAGILGKQGVNSVRRLADPRRPRRVSVAR
jgi:DNA-binding MarR family transcriptional regulator